MLFHIPKLPSEMQITHLNGKLEDQQLKLAESLMGWSEQRELKKRIERDQKQRKKDNQRIFVLDFKGDLQASSVEHLREEITIILSVAKAGRDRVIVRLESPGGLVHGYGLAAAQLARLRDAGFNLTICVDKVAASGGYMMACIAHQIIAAPFAVVGSIGVVAQMPNFHKFLKQHNIDFDVYTAGEYKRTVTVFGENTDEDRVKFESELQQTHVLFKHFVEKYRPKLNVSEVATGEHWYGEDALKLNLVDKLETSDAYLLSLLPKHDLYVLHSRKKPTLGEKLGLHAAQLSSELVPALTNVLRESLTKLSTKAVMLKDSRLGE
jgi:serine protease SohB